VLSPQQGVRQELAVVDLLALARPSRSVARLLDAEKAEEEPEVRQRPQADKHDYGEMVNALPAFKGGDRRGDDGQDHDEDHVELVKVEDGQVGDGRHERGGRRLEGDRG